MNHVTLRMLSPWACRIVEVPTELLVQVGDRSHQYEPASLYFRNEIRYVQFQSRLSYLD
jgi:hypothetical protein